MHRDHKAQQQSTNNSLPKFFMVLALKLSASESLRVEASTPTLTIEGKLYTVVLPAIPILQSPIRANRPKVSISYGNELG